MSVFIVQHVHQFSADEDDEDVKMIGVYSSRDQADLAIERLSSQPGFCDSPNGFHIGKYELDQDHWTEGFITVPPTEID